MARALRIQFPGAFYHITCRGIERREIFGNDADRYRFQRLLAQSLETYHVVLHAYIMMTNHFHLLIQTTRANCSEFMRHFNICYTGWFNHRHNRSGNLYQGRYKAFLIDANSYLLGVSRYLHVNIVRLKRMQSVPYREQWRYATDFQWSSLAGYANERRTVDYVNYDLLLSMVDGRRGYRDFMIDGLRRDIDSPFKEAKSGVILGADGFVAKIKRHLRSGSQREQPSYRDLVARALPPEAAVRILAKELKINEELLRQTGDNGMIRGIVAELLYRYCEITQARIGSMLGDIDYMSVYQLRRRLKAKMREHEWVRKRYAAAESELKKAVL